MLSIILRRNDEPKVVHLTQENLQKELRSVVGAELLVEDDWVNGVFKARNDFVCLVEADCLVSSGYFSSLMGLFRKNHEYSKLAMMASSVGVNNWANRVFGYELGREERHFDDQPVDSIERTVLKAIENKRSSQPYPVQAAFMPGAIIRTNVIRRLLEKDDSIMREDDLIKLSADLSFAFWSQGRRVYINPNSTYVSTILSLKEPANFPIEVPEKAAGVFKGESI